jgi:hypothetical protein
MPPKIADIRRLLYIFDDIELEVFCQDNYPEVKRRFARGLLFDEKVSLLLDYCDRRGQLDLLENQLTNNKYVSAPAIPTKPILNPTILKLHLSSIDDQTMEIWGLEVPGGGTPKASVCLPFSSTELRAILKALDIGKYQSSRFKFEYSEALRHLGLLQEDVLHPEFHKIIGKRLYDTIFEQGEFLVTLRIAQEHPPVIFHIQFNPEDVIPAQLPWELIHDEAVFLTPVAAGLELSRSIAFEKPPKPLKISLPLKLLYICPRPIDDMELPRLLERSSLLAALRPLSEGRQFIWNELNPPTWDALIDDLQNNSYHIIHFDGHGTYARECPKCGEAHYPNAKECSKCNTNMSMSSPMGYLHFENEDRQLNRVNVNDLKQIISNRNIQLVTLTACSSGVVHGTSVFNGVAQGLIQTGVPAVVGMQGSPSVEAMVKFVEKMYTSIGMGKRIPEAVNEARLAIYSYQPKCWFMPIIYLRSSDKTYGQLFSI